MKQLSCKLTWCQSAHDDDTERNFHHHNHLGQFRANAATIDVVARWAERRDGRQGVDPHVSIFMKTAGEAETVSDLTPREARIWAAQLDVFNGAPWLTEKLTAGADMLADWDHSDLGDAPHRVSDRPTVPPESYIFAIRMAARSARKTLAEFERFPITAMDALGLASVIGEYRGYVRYLTEALEAVEAERTPA